MQFFKLFTNIYIKVISISYCLSKMQSGKKEPKVISEAAQPQKGTTPRF